MTTVFRLDRGYDREHGGSGGSRYGQLVRMNHDLFADTWGDFAPVRFACVAWKLATPPTTNPGYVRWHRRVLSAELVRNEWDGTLTARVSLVAPSPVPLAELPPIPPPGVLPVRGAGEWQGWMSSFGQYVAPTDRDLARGPFLRSSVLAEVPVPLGGLPKPPDGPTPGFEEDAEQAVAVLARALDRLLGPVVAGLEEGLPSD